MKGLPVTLACLLSAGMLSSAAVNQRNEHGLTNSCCGGMSCCGLGQNCLCNAATQSAAVRAPHTPQARTASCCSHLNSAEPRPAFPAAGMGESLHQPSADPAAPSCQCSTPLPSPANKRIPSDRPQRVKTETHGATTLAINACVETSRSPTGTIRPQTGMAAPPRSVTDYLATLCCWRP